MDPMSTERSLRAETCPHIHITCRSTQHVTPGIQLAAPWLSIRELTRWKKRQKGRTGSRGMRGERGTDGVAGRGG